LLNWLNTFLLINKVSARSFWVKKSVWLGTLIFAICLLILFPFSLGTEVIKRADVQIGCFWAIMEFVAVLSIGRMFYAEQEAQALDILLCSQSSRSSILLAKIFFLSFTLFSLTVPILFSWTLFFNITASSFILFYGKFLLTSLFFVWGCASLGALVHALTARSLAKDIIQPILFFPLQTGLLLASVSVSLSSNSASSLSGAFNSSTWWMILILYPVIFTTLGCIFSLFLLEE
jgi:heme exporter protein B